MATILLGAVLRLVWVSDIEYKGDEAWTWEQVRAIQDGKAWPLLGMPSSKKILNPGLSLWVFVPLATVFGASDPPDLARAIQALNVLALVGLVLFALLAVPAVEREPWLWAAALVAVNPLAVLFHRKIWPPSVLPLFIVAFLWCWWYRRNCWAALGWGLIGLAMGQIHATGFLFAFGFTAWAFLFDRRHVAWGGWCVGCVLGVLPMLPWIAYLIGGHSAAAGMEPDDKSFVLWTRILEGKFWTRWVLEPLGYGLDYTLGNDYFDFLCWPLVEGSPTYLVLVLHVIVGLTGLAIFAKAVRRVLRKRPALGETIVGGGSQTAFTQNAALWGYGLVVTLSCLPIHRHYMIVLFPLQFLWLARLALGSGPIWKQGRILLAVLVICQGLLSVEFLSYVHASSGIHGDYRVPYRAQDRSQR